MADPIIRPIITSPVIDPTIVDPVIDVIFGEQGAQGVQGPQGLTGPQGPQGATGAQGAGGALGYYGSFLDTTTQVAASTTVAYPLEINTTSEANGVSITNDLSGNPTQITFGYAGTYSLIFSIQFTNDGASEAYTSIWLRLNGSDIPASRSQWTVPKPHGGDPGSVIGTVEFTQTFAAGDDLQIMWQTESTDVEVMTLPAGTTPDSPQSPSIILGVQQVMYLQDALVVQPNAPSSTDVLWLDTDAVATNPAISTTIVDAKGDLIAGTAADSVARVPVGANNTVLTADSGQMAGVKWATPVSAAAPFVTLATDATLTGERVLTAGAGITLTDGGAGSTVTVAAGFGSTAATSASWFFPIINGEGRTTWGHTVGQLIAMPILLRAGTLDRIAIYHSNTTVTGGVGRLGIYEDSNGLPGALLLDAGTVDLSTTAAAIKSVTITQAVSNKTYWVAYARQGTAGNAQIVSYNQLSGSALAVNIAATSASLFDSVRVSVTVSSVTGAFPSTFGTPTGTIAQAPMIFVRYA